MNLAKKYEQQFHVVQILPYNESGLRPGWSFNTEFSILPPRTCHANVVYPAYSTGLLMFLYTNIRPVNYELERFYQRFYQIGGGGSTCHTQ